MGKSDEKTTMGQKEVSQNKAIYLAEKLNSMACNEYVKCQVENHEGPNDPLRDIAHCAELGLITNAQAKRLSSEVKIVVSES